MRTRNLWAGLIAIWSSLGILFFAILTEDWKGLWLSLFFWVTGITLVSGYLRQFRQYVKERRGETEPEEIVIDNDKTTLGRC